MALSGIIITGGTSRMYGRITPNKNICLGVKGIGNNGLVFGVKKENLEKFCETSKFNQLLEKAKLCDFNEKHLETIIKTLKNALTEIH